MVESKVSKFKNDCKKYGSLFPFYIPAALLAIVFMYIPMLGLIMAFKENPNMIGSDTPVQGILASGWVGFENFLYIFSQPSFLQALGNTLYISFLKIVISFPLPIILAIFLTEIRGKVMRTAVQITMYLPYFLSWAIIGGIFNIMFGQEQGLVNNVMAALGFERYGFMQSNDTFRGIVVLMAIWKDLGWSTVTYIAAISALDPGLNEAAEIDGATKVQQIRHIMLPGIMATIAVLFILRIGYIMDAGFEQIFVIYTPYVEKSGDILGLFSYRLLRDQMIPQYHLSTAIGLFNSIVAFLLVISGNLISKKCFKRSIW